MEEMNTEEIRSENPEKENKERQNETVFIVRLNASYTFVQERLQEYGAYWGRFFDALPEQANAKMLHDRFTHYVFTLQAKTKKICKDLVLNTWKTVFGDDSDITGIFIADYSDEENADIIRRFYNYYFGYEDVLKLITEMTGQLPYLRSKKVQDILIKQNFLVASDPGSGFTLFLASLSEFYCRQVYPGCREEAPDSYLEMVLGKEDNNGYTTEDVLLEKLCDEESKKEINLVGIDISIFLERNKMDDLRRFVRRLYNLQNEYVFVFRIPFLEKRAFDEIYQALADVLFIRSIQFSPLHDVLLIDKAWEMLQDKEFLPELSVIDPMIERIHQEKMDGRFYGFKTMENIVSEMILRKSRYITDKLEEGIIIDDVRIGAEHVAGLVSRETDRVTGYQALAELIGMESIMAKIKEMIAQIKVAMNNEKLERPCIHMRFTGAPGTGKTTVARIIGQIMKEEGILRKGAFFEYSGRDLVAEYVGQTAVKTASICRDSYGSVLFIDEAYALYDGQHMTNDFGKEAITTLISEMENHRDDMLVVMAGYTEEMDTLMKANPGIRSRMPCVLHFQNYSRKQLFEIFMLMVRKHFLYDPGLEEAAQRYFDALSDAFLESKEFANARFVRNLYERTWSKGALRASLNGIKMIVLTREDFIAASSEKEFNEKIETKKIIGF